jgi:hypothetical protein
LLPLQYSNCLRVSGKGNPQLVRANMYFAGILFSGDADARIDFDFGFFHSKCRWADITDVKRLRIPESADPARPGMRPFAIRSMSDVAIRWEQVRQARNAALP